VPRRGQLGSSDGSVRGRFRPVTVYDCSDRLVGDECERHKNPSLHSMPVKTLERQNLEVNRSVTSGDGRVPNASVGPDRGHCNQLCETVSSTLPLFNNFSCLTPSVSLAVPFGLYEGYCDLPDFYAEDQLNNDFSSAEGAACVVLDETESELSHAVEGSALPDVHTCASRELSEYPAVSSALRLGRIRSELNVDSELIEQCGVAKDYPSVREAVSLGKYVDERQLDGDGEELRRTYDATKGPASAIVTRGKSAKLSAESRSSPVERAAVEQDTRVASSLVCADDVSESNEHREVTADSARRLSREYPTVDTAVRLADVRSALTMDRALLEEYAIGNDYPSVLEAVALSRYVCGLEINNTDSLRGRHADCKSQIAVSRELSVVSASSLVPHCEPESLSRQHVNLASASENGAFSNQDPSAVTDSEAGSSHRRDSASLGQPSETLATVDVAGDHSTSPQAADIKHLADNYQTLQHVLLLNDIRDTLKYRESAADESSSVAVARLADDYPTVQESFQLYRMAKSSDSHLMHDVPTYAGLCQSAKPLDAGNDIISDLPGSHTLGSEDDGYHSPINFQSLGSSGSSASDKLKHVKTPYCCISETETSHVMKNLKESHENPPEMPLPTNPETRLRENASLTCPRSIHLRASESEAFDMKQAETIDGDSFTTVISRKHRRRQRQRAVSESAASDGQSSLVTQMIYLPESTRFKNAEDDLKHCLLTDSVSDQLLPVKAELLASDDRNYAFPVSESSQLLTEIKAEGQAEDDQGLVAEQVIDPLAPIRESEAELLCSNYPGLVTLSDLESGNLCDSRDVICNIASLTSGDFVTAIGMATVESPDSAVDLTLDLEIRRNVDENEASQHVGPSPIQCSSSDALSQTPAFGQSVSDCFSAVAKLHDVEAVGNDSPVQVSHSVATAAVCTIRDNRVDDLMSKEFTLKQETAVLACPEQTQDVPNAEPRRYTLDNVEASEPSDVNDVGVNDGDNDGSFTVVISKRHKRHLHYRLRSECSSEDGDKLGEADDHPCQRPELETLAPITTTVEDVDRELETTVCVKDPLDNRTDKVGVGNLRDSSSDTKYDIHQVSLVSSPVQTNSTELAVDSSLRRNVNVDTVLSIRATDDANEAIGKLASECSTQNAGEVAEAEEQQGNAEALNPLCVESGVSELELETVIICANAEPILSAEELLSESQSSPNALVENSFLTDSSQELFSYWITDAARWTSYFNGRYALNDFESGNLISGRSLSFDSAGREKMRRSENRKSKSEPGDVSVVSATEHLETPKVALGNAENREEAAKIQTILAVRGSDDNETTVAVGRLNEWVSEQEVNRRVATERTASDVRGSAVDALVTASDSKNQTSSNDDNDGSFTVVISRKHRRQLRTRSECSNEDSERVLEAFQQTIEFEQPTATSVVTRVDEVNVELESRSEEAAIIESVSVDNLTSEKFEPPQTRRGAESVEHRVAQMSSSTEPLSVESFPVASCLTQSSTDAEEPKGDALKSVVDIFDAVTERLADVVGGVTQGAVLELDGEHLSESDRRPQTTSVNELVPRAVVSTEIRSEPTAPQLHDPKELLNNWITDASRCTSNFNAMSALNGLENGKMIEKFPESSAADGHVQQQENNTHISRSDFGSVGTISNSQEKLEDKLTGTATEKLASLDTEVGCTNPVSHETVAALEASASEETISQLKNVGDVVHITSTLAHAEIPGSSVHECDTSKPITCTSETRSNDDDDGSFTVVISRKHRRQLRTRSECSNEDNEGVHETEAQTGGCEQSSLEVVSSVVEEINEEGESERSEEATVVETVSFDRVEPTRDSSYDPATEQESVSSTNTSVESESRVAELRPEVASTTVTEVNLPASELGEEPVESKSNIVESVTKADSGDEKNKTREDSALSEVDSKTKLNDWTSDGAWWTSYFSAMHVLNEWENGNLINQRAVSSGTFPSEKKQKAEIRQTQREPVEVAAKVLDENERKEFEVEEKAKETVPQGEVSTETGVSDATEYCDGTKPASEVVSLNECVHEDKLTGVIVEATSNSRMMVAADVTLNQRDEPVTAPDNKAETSINEDGDGSFTVVISRKHRRQLRTRSECSNEDNEGMQEAEVQTGGCEHSTMELMDSVVQEAEENGDLCCGESLVVEQVESLEEVKFRESGDTTDNQLAVQDSEMLTNSSVAVECRVDEFRPGVTASAAECSVESVSKLQEESVEDKSRQAESFPSAELTEDRPRTYQDSSVSDVDSQTDINPWLTDGAWWTSYFSAMHVLNDFENGSSIWKRPISCGKSSSKRVQENDSNEVKSEDAVISVGSTTTTETEKKESDKRVAEGGVTKGTEITYDARSSEEVETTLEASNPKQSVSTEDKVECVVCETTSSAANADSATTASDGQGDTNTNVDDDSSFTVVISRKHRRQLRTRSECSNEDNEGVHETEAQTGGCEQSSLEVVSSVVEEINEEGESERSEEATVVETVSFNRVEPTRDSSYDPATEQESVSSTNTSVESESRVAEFKPEVASTTVTEVNLSASELGEEPVESKSNIVESVTKADSGDEKNKTREDSALSEVDSKTKLNDWTSDGAWWTSYFSAMHVLNEWENGNLINRRAVSSGTFPSEKKQKAEIRQTQREPVEVAAKVLDENERKEFEVEEKAKETVPQGEVSTETGVSDATEYCDGTKPASEVVSLNECVHEDKLTGVIVEATSNSRMMVAADVTLNQRDEPVTASDNKAETSINEDGDGSFTVVISRKHRRQLRTRSECSNEDNEGMHEAEADRVRCEQLIVEGVSSVVEVVSEEGDLKGEEGAVIEFSAVDTGAGGPFVPSQEVSCCNKDDVVSDGLPIEKDTILQVNSSPELLAVGALKIDSEVTQSSPVLKVRSSTNSEETSASELDTIPTNKFDMRSEASSAQHETPPAVDDCMAPSESSCDLESAPVTDAACQRQLNREESREAFRYWATDAARWTSYFSVMSVLSDLENGKIMNKHVVGPDSAFVEKVQQNTGLTNKLEAHGNAVTKLNESQESNSDNKGKHLESSSEVDIIQLVIAEATPSAVNQEASSDAFVNRNVPSTAREGDGEANENDNTDDGSFTVVISRKHRRQLRTRSECSNEDNDRDHETVAQTAACEHVELEHDTHVVTAVEEVTKEHEYERDEATVTERVPLAEVESLQEVTGGESENLSRDLLADHDLAILRDNAVELGSSVDDYKLQTAVPVVACAVLSPGGLSEESASGNTVHVNDAPETTNLPQERKWFSQNLTVSDVDSENDVNPWLTDGAWWTSYFSAMHVLNDFENGSCIWKRPISCGKSSSKRVQENESNEVKSEDAVISVGSTTTTETETEKKKSAVDEKSVAEGGVTTGSEISYDIRSSEEVETTLEASTPKQSVSTEDKVECVVCETTSSAANADSATTASDGQGDTNTNVDDDGSFTVVISRKHRRQLRTRSECSNEDNEGVHETEAQTGGCEQSSLEVVSSVVEEINEEGESERSEEATVVETVSFDRVEPTQDSSYDPATEQESVSSTNTSVESESRVAELRPEVASTTVTEVNLSASELGEEPVESKSNIVESVTKADSGDEKNKTREDSALSEVDSKTKLNDWTSDGAWWTSYFSAMHVLNEWENGNLINRRAVSSGTFPSEKKQKAEIRQTQREPVEVAAKVLDENERKEFEVEEKAKETVPQGEVSTETGVSDATEYCDGTQPASAVVSLNECVHEDKLTGVIVEATLNSRMMVAADVTLNQRDEPVTASDNKAETSINEDGDGSFTVVISRKHRRQLRTRSECSNEDNEGVHEAEVQTGGCEHSTMELMDSVVQEAEENGDLCCGESLVVEQVESLEEVKFRESGDTTDNQLAVQDSEMLTNSSVAVECRVDEFRPGVTASAAECSVESVSKLQEESVEDKSRQAESFPSAELTEERPRTYQDSSVSDVDSQTDINPWLTDGAWWTSYFSAMHVLNDFENGSSISKRPISCGKSSSKRVQENDSNEVKSEDAVISVGSTTTTETEKKESDKRVAEAGVTKGTEITYDARRSEEVETTLEASSPKQSVSTEDKVECVVCETTSSAANADSATTASDGQGDTNTNVDVDGSFTVVISRKHRRQLRTRSECSNEENEGVHETEAQTGGCEQSSLEVVSSVVEEINEEGESERSEEATVVETVSFDRVEPTQDSSYDPATEQESVSSTNTSVESESRVAELRPEVASTTVTEVNLSASELGEEPVESKSNIVESVTKADSGDEKNKTREDSALSEVDSKTKLNDWTSDGAWWTSYFSAMHVLNEWENGNLINRRAVSSGTFPSEKKQKAEIRQTQREPVEVAAKVLDENERKEFEVEEKAKETVPQGEVSTEIGVSDATEYCDGTQPASEVVSLNECVHEDKLTGVIVEATSNSRMMVAADVTLSQRDEPVTAPDNKAETSINEDGDGSFTVVISRKHRRQLRTRSECSNEDNDRDHETVAQTAACEHVELEHDTHVVTAVEEVTKEHEYERDEATVTERVPLAEVESLQEVTVERGWSSQEVRSSKCDGLSGDLPAAENDAVGVSGSVETSSSMELPVESASAQTLSHSDELQNSGDIDETTGAIVNSTIDHSTDIGAVVKTTAAQQVIARDPNALDLHRETNVADELEQLSMSAAATAGVDSGELLNYMTSEAAQWTSYCGVMSVLNDLENGNATSARPLKSVETAEEGLRETNERKSRTKPGEEPGIGDDRVVGREDRTAPSEMNLVADREYPEAAVKEEMEIEMELEVAFSEPLVVSESISTSLAESEATHNYLTNGFVCSGDDRPAADEASVTVTSDLDAVVPKAADDSRGLEETGELNKSIVLQRGNLSSDTEVNRDAGSTSFTEAIDTNVTRSDGLVSDDGPHEDAFVCVESKRHRRQRLRKESERNSQSEAFEPASESAASQLSEANDYRPTTDDSDTALVRDRDRLGISVSPACKESDTAPCDTDVADGDVEHAADKRTSVRVESDVDGTLPETDRLITEVAETLDVHCKPADLEMKIENKNGEEEQTASLQSEILTVVSDEFPASAPHDDADAVHSEQGSQFVQNMPQIVEKSLYSATTCTGESDDIEQANIEQSADDLLTGSVEVTQADDGSQVTDVLSDPLFHDSRITVTEGNSAVVRSDSVNAVDEVHDETDFGRRIEPSAVGEIYSSTAFDAVTLEGDNGKSRITSVDSFQPQTDGQTSELHENEHVEQFFALNVRWMREGAKGAAPSGDGISNASVQREFLLASSTTSDVGQDLTECDAASHRTVDRVQPEITQCNEVITDSVTASSSKKKKKNKHKKKVQPLKTVDGELTGETTEMHHQLSVELSDQQNYTDSIQLPVESSNTTVNAAAAEAGHDPVTPRAEEITYIREPSVTETSADEVRLPVTLQHWSDVDRSLTPYDCSIIDNPFLQESPKRTAKSFDDKIEESLPTVMQPIEVDISCSGENEENEELLQDIRGDSKLDMALSLQPTEFDGSVADRGEVETPEASANTTASSSRKKKKNKHKKKVQPSVSETNSDEVRLPVTLQHGDDIDQSQTPYDCSVTDNPFLQESPKRTAKSFDDKIEESLPTVMQPIEVDISCSGENKENEELLQDVRGDSKLDMALSLQPTEFDGSVADRSEVETPEASANTTASSSRKKKKNKHKKKVQPSVSETNSDEVRLPVTLQHGDDIDQSQTPYDCSVTDNPFLQESPKRTAKSFDDKIEESLPTVMQPIEVDISCSGENKENEELLQDVRGDSKLDMALSLQPTEFDGSVADRGEVETPEASANITASSSRKKKNKHKKKVQPLKTANNDLTERTTEVHCQLSAGLCDLQNDADTVQFQVESSSTADVKPSSVVSAEREPAQSVVKTVEIQEPIVTKTNSEEVRFAETQQRVSDGSSQQAVRSSKNKKNRKKLNRRNAPGEKLEHSTPLSSCAASQYLEEGARQTNSSVDEDLHSVERADSEAAELVICSVTDAGVSDKKHWPLGIELSDVNEPTASVRQESAEIYDCQQPRASPQKPLIGEVKDDVEKDGGRRVMEPGNNGSVMLRNSSVSDEANLPEVGRKAEKTKKRKRKRRPKKRSSSDDQQPASDTSLSYLLDQIVALCAPSGGERDALLESGSRPLHDGKYTVADRDATPKAEVAKSRQLKRYARTKACKLRAGEVLTEKDVSVIADAVREIENADNEIEETEIMLAVSASVKHPEATCVAFSDGSRLKPADVTVVPPAAADADAAVASSETRSTCDICDRPVRENPDGATTPSGDSVPSCRDAVSPCEENSAPDVNGERSVHAEKPASQPIEVASSGHLQSPPNVADRQSSLDRFADSEVEMILAGGVQCPSDVDEEQLEDAGSRAEASPATSGADTYSGSEPVSIVDDVIITEYLDVEIVEETETVTVIESIYEAGDVSPSTTLRDDDDDESVSFQAVHEEENTYGLYSDWPPVELQTAEGARVDGDRQLQSAVTGDERGAAACDVERKAERSDDAASVAAPSVAEDMFYPQWLGRAGPPRRHLPGVIGGLSRKRLHSHEAADSDDDDDERGRPALNQAEEQHKGLQYLIAHHEAERQSYEIHGLETRQSYAGQSFVLHERDWNSRSLPTGGDTAAFVLEADDEPPSWIFDRSSDYQRAPVTDDETGREVFDDRLQMTSPLRAAADDVDDRKRFDDSLDEDDCRQPTFNKEPATTSPAVGQCVSRVKRRDELTSEASETCSNDSLDGATARRQPNSSIHQQPLSSPDKFSDDSLADEKLTAKRAVVGVVGGPSDSSSANVAAAVDNALNFSGRTESKPTKSKGSSQRNRKSRKK
jgi:hypothetical protein